ncbi:glycosyltransferase [Aquipuribacter nitratireducens]|uniref:D-inositol 3-phosphate glycosyltransferase n=1 Tax=Aquipuribacter nitratireducens TaxID=650104 RepID=A0ABW0GHX6_9MICO
MRDVARRSGATDLLREAVRRSYPLRRRLWRVRERLRTRLLGARPAPVVRRRRVDRPLPPELRATLAAARAVLTEHGDLTGAATVLADVTYADVRDNRPAEALLAHVRGLHGLRPEAVPVPPRQHAALYSPRRDAVVYVAYSAPPHLSNGYAQRTGGLTSALAGLGRDVRVVTRPGFPWDEVEGVGRAERRVVPLDGATLVLTPGADRQRDQFLEYLAVSADLVAREARAHRAGVVHAASNYTTGLAGLIAARRLGVPFVYEVRGLWEVTGASANPGYADSEMFRLQRDLEALCAREADHVLAITEQVKDELVRRGVDADRISLAPNSVDVDDYAPLDRVDLGPTGVDLPPGVPVVGYAGSFVQYEGLDVLLDAVALLRERGVPLHLLLVGDGKEGPRLRERTAALGLQGHVTFTGRVDHVQARRLMHLFDVVAVPRRSLAVTELVSALKPLEALATARPLVVTSVAPHVVYTQDGTTGSLAAPDDAGSLADALEPYLRDGTLRAETGRRGRAWVVEHRSWQSTAARVAAVHDALVTVGTGAQPGRPLADLRVGLVADRFTTDTFGAEVQPVRLVPGDTGDVLDGLDLLLVESAWEGNGGAWTKLVGCYEDTGLDRLAELVEACRERGVPTVFWNKEDPVHYRRFAPAAALFDHVLTTDATMIRRYMREPGTLNRTVSSLPFAAQPLLHRPVATQPLDSFVAYAGTYYGDRYPDRSAELDDLLDAAAEVGLTVYDRQLLHPDSPYHFPERFSGAVRGGLPYDAMVEAYRHHPVHLNVNSVTDSPTMFSRRVVEIAASGAAVLSGRGRGVVETLGDDFPVVADRTEAAAVLHRWHDEPHERLVDALAMFRAVHRAHLVGHRLAHVARTVGLAVEGPAAPPCTLVVDRVDTAVVEAVLRQTVHPTALATPAPDPTVAQVAAMSGIRLVAPDEAPADAARLEAGADDVLTWPETLVEDVLHVARAVGRDVVVDRRPVTRTTPLVVDPASPAGEGLGLGPDGADALAAPTGPRLLVPGDERSPVVLHHATPAPRDRLEVRPRPHRVLVAGHDLKFAEPLLARLRAEGHEVLEDRWQGHNQHDAARSEELLGQADVVLCEWLLGNAAWYSRRVRPGQRLVGRLHAQELRSNLLAAVRLDRFDDVMFVGPHVRDVVTLRLGLDAARTSVVPNYVDVAALRLDKTPEAARTIGFVGMTPRAKRLDLALDVVAGIRERGHDVVLRVRGKRPEDYPWMKDRPDELAWYEGQLARLTEDPRLAGAVHLDGFGEMPQWYRQVGFVLSTSDHESFHLTVADGAASGAVPLLLAWPGADRVYPPSWVSASVDALVDRAVGVLEDDTAAARAREGYRRTAAQLFDPEETMTAFCRSLFGPEG